MSCSSNVFLTDLTINKNAKVTRFCLNGYMLLTKQNTWQNPSTGCKLNENAKVIRFRLDGCMLLDKIP